MLVLENAVAQRSLTFKREGASVQATAYLGLPFEEHSCWVCEYGVISTGMEDKHIHKIIGDDSMQALQLAIVMLGSMLSNLEGISDWRWNGEPYIGLPNSVRDPIFGDMP